MNKLGIQLIVISVMLYASETWTMLVRILEVFHVKCHWKANTSSQVAAVRLR